MVEQVEQGNLSVEKIVAMTHLTRKMPSDRCGFPYGIVFLRNYSSISVQLVNSFPNFKNPIFGSISKGSGKEFHLHHVGGDILKIIYLTNLGKLVYVSI